MNWRTLKISGQNLKFQKNGDPSFPPYKKKSPYIKKKKNANFSSSTSTSTSIKITSSSSFKQNAVSFLVNPELTISPSKKQKKGVTQRIGSF
jgi:hypothetical protein